MERTLLSWNVPNMITIWLMVLGLVAAYAVGAQIFVRTGIGGSASNTNQGGGY